MEQKGGKRGLPRSTDLHYLLLSDTDRQPQTATDTVSVRVISDLKMEGPGKIN